LGRLQDTLAVQPVSYTDLFVVRVRAHSPEEAQRRAGLLTDFYAHWDSSEDRAEAQQLVGLLRSRLQQVTRELGQLRSRLQAQKAGLSLSLGGSASARQLEADIAARVATYDRLTAEIESAERPVRGDAAPRTRVLAPPTLPGKPVLSRPLMAFIALCLSLLLSAGLLCLLEWLDPTVRRTQDVAREAPSCPVIALPAFANGDFANGPSPHLSPLVNAIAERVARTGAAVVQFSSPSADDGKTAISTALAQLLAAEFRVCRLHRSQAPTLDAADEGAEPGAAENRPAEVTVGIAEPLEKRLRSLRERYEVVLIDNDTIAGSPAGTSLIGEADLSCLVVSAGKTSRYAIRALRNQFKRLPERPVFFLLNRFSDPLPSWLRPA
jgi:hypothetical protein